MTSEMIIFTITAGGLMIVEGLLIIKVIGLTKTIQKMNNNIDNTQKLILDKIRAVVDLFLKAQTIDFNKFKSGSMEFHAGKTNINVKVKQNDRK